MNELAGFEEAKEDWYGWGLGREGDDFGGGVREVGRKGLWATVESAYLFQVSWEASERL